MTTLVHADAFALDIERIIEHLVAHEAEHIDERLSDIFEALALLVRHPLIGRPAATGQRDLVIGQGARGYVARYRYDPLHDEVTVPALRAQREAGFVDR